MDLLKRKLTDITTIGCNENGLKDDAKTGWNENGLKDNETICWKGNGLTDITTIGCNGNGLKDDAKIGWNGNGVTYIATIGSLFIWLSERVEEMSFWVLFISGQNCFVDCYLVQVTSDFVKTSW